MAALYLSLVILAFNRVSAIRSGKLTCARGRLARQPYGSELVVVDDGSEDAGTVLAWQAVTRVLPIPHVGKAGAFVAGIRNASGDIVLLTDMNQATPIAEQPHLLEATAWGVDIATGSRGMVRPGAPPSGLVVPLVGPI